MLNQNSDTKEFKQKVFDYGISLSARETPKMTLADNTFFPIVAKREILLKLNKSNRLKNSFPRGFLLNGIFDYSVSTNDNESLKNLESLVDTYVANIINTSEKITYTDQITMGMVIVKFYEKNNNSDYKQAIEILSNWLKKSVDKKYGVILYRANLDFQYVDTLGMICPFLILAGKALNQKELIELSNTQIRFYIENGLQPSGLPFHAIDLVSKLPMGSSNWGRGLGWYLLALSFTLKHTNNSTNADYNYFSDEFKKVLPTIQLLKNKHYWGQFLGVSKKWETDTSASCMIYYSLSILDEETNLNDFYNFIKPCTTKKGAIDYTSGDTEDINLYSREYGSSELTQGLLLSIFENETISHEKNIN